MEATSQKCFLQILKVKMKVPNSVLRGNIIDVSFFSKQKRLFLHERNWRVKWCYSVIVYFTFFFPPNRPSWFLKQPGVKDLSVPNLTLQPLIRLVLFFSSTQLLHVVVIVVVNSSVGMFVVLLSSGNEFYILADFLMQMFWLKKSYVSSVSS